MNLIFHKHIFILTFLFSTLGVINIANAGQTNIYFTSQQVRGDRDSYPGVYYHDGYRPRYHHRRDYYERHAYRERCRWVPGYMMDGRWYPPHRECRNRW